MYSEGRIYKSEREPRNCKYRLLLSVIRGNIRISCTEFVYDKQARDFECLWPYASLGVMGNYDDDDDDCKCVLIFVVPV